MPVKPPSRQKLTPPNPHGIGGFGDQHKLRLAVNPVPSPKGQGGNSNKWILLRAYRKKLAEAHPADPERRTYADMIASTVIEAACAGDIKAAAEVRQVVEGALLRVEGSYDWKRQIKNMGLDPGKIMEQLADALGALPRSTEPSSEE